jgi:hypothetical protein
MNQWMILTISKTNKEKSDLDWPNFFISLSDRDNNYWVLYIELFDDMKM